MASEQTYEGLFKVAKQLTLGKCECGRDIVVDVELAHDEEEAVSAAVEAVVEKGASVSSSENNGSFSALVKKASFIVDQLDDVATQVENQNPRLAARIDAVSNEIEKRVARLLQRRQNAK